MEGYEEVDQAFYAQYGWLPIFDHKPVQIGEILDDDWPSPRDGHLKRSKWKVIGHLSASDDYLCRQELPGYQGALPGYKGYRMEAMD